MHRSTVHSLTALLAAVILLAAPGCSDTIDDPFVRVGALRVFPIDPGQSIGSIDVEGVQAVEFRLSEVTVVLDGTEIDLLGGAGECLVVDTVLTPPVFDTDLPCALGIVVGETDGPKTMTVRARVEGEFTRQEPLLFERNGDLDGDGFPNFVDDCPLIPDPEQTDANADGIGDACEVASPFDPLATAIDNDGDGVADIIDNCDYVPNEDQTDVSPFPGAPFGIGSACPIQTGVLYQNGSPSIELDLVVDGVDVGFGRPTFLVLDFDNRDAVDCDWERGRCDLVEGGFQACATDRQDTVSFGCI